jgi:hypothetical protein
MRRCGRSKHTLRVLSIVGACRSCRRVVASLAISRGRCVRGRTVLPLPRTRIASGWSHRAFPRVVSLPDASPADYAPMRYAPRLSHRSSRRLCTRVYVQTRARRAGRDDRRDDHSRRPLPGGLRAPVPPADLDGTARFAVLAQVPVKLRALPSGNAHEFADLGPFLGGLA